MTADMYTSETSAPPAGLDDIVGDVETFFKDHWANQPYVWRSPSAIDTLISEEEIWEEVEGGFLSRPYFTMFNEGVRSAMSDITVSRKVVGHELSGFINAPQVRREFEQGGTFKFNQAEHWHPRIRALVKNMEPHFRGGLEAFVFLSPPGKTAIQAHTDGAHVFVLQVAGSKDWVVGRLDETATSDSTLHEGEILPHLRMEMTLHTGDVLYMPHGCPHYATARTGNSIHVAITVEEPSALDLANVRLAELLAEITSAEDPKLNNLGALATRVQAVRERALASLRNTNPADVLNSTINLRKSHRI